MTTLLMLHVSNRKQAYKNICAGN